jgi:hypothetical protein
MRDTEPGTIQKVDDFVPGSSLMPAIGFGLSLDGGVIIADFGLEDEDDVTFLLLFRDITPGA